MSEAMIRLDVELQPEGIFLVTSPDVPGLVGEARTASEGVELGQRLARTILEVCMDNDFPVPPALQSLLPTGSPVRFTVPVGVR